VLRQRPLQSSIGGNSWLRLDSWQCRISCLASLAAAGQGSWVGVSGKKREAPITEDLEAYGVSSAMDQGPVEILVVSVHVLRSEGP
jgi:hypothetical protein